MKCSAQRREQLGRVVICLVCEPAQNALGRTGGRAECILTALDEHVSLLGPQGMMKVTYHELGFWLISITCWPPLKSRCQSLLQSSNQTVEF